MRKIALASAIAVSLSMTSMTAFADDHSKITVGVGASVTQGFGVDLGYDLTESLRVRGNYYSYDDNESDTIDGINFDVNLELENTGLFVDYHPFSSKHSGFRLTAGAISNGSSLSATGVPVGGNYTIDGTTYTAAQVGSLAAEVEFDSFAPYLGLGYDLSVTENLALVSDLGIMFQGSPTVNYTANGTLASDPTFMADLEAERRSAEDDLSDFEYMPILKVGIQYRF